MLSAVWAARMNGGPDHTPGASPSWGIGRAKLVGPRRQRALGWGDGRRAGAKRRGQPRRCESSWSTTTRWSSRDSRRCSPPSATGCRWSARPSAPSGRVGVVDGPRSRHRAVRRADAGLQRPGPVPDAARARPGPQGRDAVGLRRRAVPVPGAAGGRVGLSAQEHQQRRAGAPAGVRAPRRDRDRPRDGGPRRRHRRPAAARRVLARRPAGPDPAGERDPVLRGQRAVQPRASPPSW